MGKIRILAVVGPTASGKTALAAELALRFGGEVISADSMQVYREMNIATAKPSAEEQKGVPHHLIDYVDPEEPYNLAPICGRRSGSSENGWPAKEKSRF